MYLFLFPVKPMFSLAEKSERGERKVPLGIRWVEQEVRETQHWLFAAGGSLRCVIFMNLFIIHRKLFSYPCIQNTHSVMTCKQKHLQIGKWKLRIEKIKKRFDGGTKWSCRENESAFRWNHWAQRNGNLVSMYLVSSWWNFWRVVHDVQDFG